MHDQAHTAVEEPRAAPGSASLGPTRFAITGMTCGNCARHVTEAIQSVPGVRSARVDLEAQTAEVRWKEGIAGNGAAIVQAVHRAGFEAAAMSSYGAGSDDSCGCKSRLADWRFTVGIALCGMAPLMVGEWVLGLGRTRWFQWFSLAMAGMVQVLAGARFYQGAWRQLKAGGSNMDTLVALGSTTAFLYSAWALFSGQAGHLYFMEAAAIIALVSVGHWLESRMSARAADALRQLMRLAPAMACRRNPDGSETQVPLAVLTPGDAVVLRPGERVPTDGTVLEGDSAVDESMLTGESVPVDKTVSHPLYAGTLNLNGRLIMRITATGEETALAHIIAAVQQAQSSRARIQRLADRVSNFFVPVVVVTALAAGLWWGLAPDLARKAHDALAAYLWHANSPPAAAAGFIVAAAVLIVACPCAMGLATPAALMAGTNAAARRGILIRDAAALERAGQITAVIFDKTGTLTKGKAEVVGVELVAANGSTALPQDAAEAKGKALALAASVAALSAHPVSQALATLSTTRIALADWQELRGCGLRARLGGSDGSPRDSSILRVGSLAWLREAGVDLEAGRTVIERWTGQGATVTGLALDTQLLAVFGVKDTLKPGARQVMESLHHHGLACYLVTGDNALTAASIAAAAGIPSQNVFAGIPPDAKAALVRQLQERGQRVAFVGDGINDAPALEQADLGIAVSQASDIAREAADMILLNSEIEAVPESLRLARATLRTIRQNLFWAFFYNAISIPLAALGFLSPVLCAAAMGLSDLVVIGNALRLSRNARSGVSVP